MSASIEFVGEVSKVQTLADFGLRVTLDLPEDETATAAALMEYRKLRIAVKVTIEPEA